MAERSFLMRELQRLTRALERAKLQRTQAKRRLTKAERDVKARRKMLRDFTRANQPGVAQCPTGINDEQPHVLGSRRECLSCDAANAYMSRH